MAATIEPGSRSAWTVKLLLTAWISEDADKVEAALSMAEADQPGVLTYLLVLVASQIDVLAALLGVPYDAALQRVLVVLALNDDNEPGRAMREALTVWAMSGSRTDADARKLLRGTNGVGPNDLIVQFLQVAVLLTHLVARFSNTSPRAVRESWWHLLGTAD